jgi:chromate reductase
MKRILAFGASTSSKSINKQFAHYAAHQLKDADLTLIDLNDFPAPLYSIDLEDSSGIPDSAKRLVEGIKSMDGVIISMAEHNGSYTAAFKNLMDWMSRMENNFWADKKLFLLSTSPGGRGGQSVHEAASARFPRHGGEITASFSLPHFYDNFSSEGIKDPTLAEEFTAKLTQFEASL